MLQIYVEIMSSDSTCISFFAFCFCKQNPSISSFEPIEGPAAGGTMVKIEGMYLDAGYNITARIGSECTMVE